MALTKDKCWNKLCEIAGYDGPYAESSTTPGTCTHYPSLGQDVFWVKECAQYTENLCKKETHSCHWIEDVKPKETVPVIKKKRANHDAVVIPICIIVIICALGLGYRQYRKMVLASEAEIEEQAKKLGISRTAIDNKYISRDSSASNA